MKFKTGEKKMEMEWTNIETDIDTVDWKGNAIHLKSVPALKNSQNGKVRVDPAEVAKAEIREMAKKYGLEGRDVALILMVFAKPGPFQEGFLPLKYRLNKSLFYLWKDLEMEGLGEAFPHDEFDAFPRGPVPKHINEDLKRQESLGLVRLKYTRWGKLEKQSSLTTELTPQGMKIAQELWSSIADPFKKEIVRIKERIFPLDPLTIRQRVHREYPEYQKIYVEDDTD